MEDIYFSSFSGNEIDTVITALQNMPFQISIIGATANSSVNCRCDEVNYNKTIAADSQGSCVFDDIQNYGYGTYIISNDDNTYSYVIDTHKIYQIEL